MGEQSISNADVLKVEQKRRDAGKLTQQQLAAKMGIAYQTYKNRLVTANKVAANQVEFEEEQAELNKKAQRREKALPGRINKGNVRRLVVTCAQNATPVHDGFLKSIEQYLKHHNAELIVIPTRYKNPTSQWTQEQDNAEWWDTKIAKYLVSDRLEINSNLDICAEIKTLPTAAQPLSGFDEYTSGKSGIFGHPKVQFKTVATPQNRVPKILTTTGAITVENYTDSKAGRKGEFHHQIAATVIEVSGERFHIRQITANDDGSFTDLAMAYNPTGFKPAQQAKALIMGDTHAYFLNEQVRRATWKNKDCLLNALLPENLVWHDVLDMFSGSHHHKKSPVLQFMKHHRKMNNVQAEITKTFAVMDDATRPGMTNIVVPSNHHDHLSQWLQETDPKRDPENAIFYHTTMANWLDHVDKRKPFEPFVWHAKQTLKQPAQFEFLKRDEGLSLLDIDIGFHGDKGTNGARGSRQSFSKIGVKTVIGHSHSPGIEGGCYQVGTSSDLDLEYVSGPSSWLHTHCVIYADGKRSLINLIDGEYQL